MSMSDVKSTVFSWLKQATEQEPERGLTIMKPVQLRPIAEPLHRPHPVPGVIPLRYGRQPRTARLSDLLRIGSAIHPLCRGDFVEQVICSHYAYSRRISYRTNPIAAIYVGAYGPSAIEADTFSYSMAVWRINQTVGFDIGEVMVDGPTGWHNKLVDELIRLVDEEYWTREGIAEWLWTLGL